MLKFPLPLGTRHPRYTIALAAFVLCAYWFFSSPTPLPRPVQYNASHDLHARLEREERKYRDMIPQRHDLITRFGPTPAQVVMFPPDQDPWPAYTVWDFFPPIFNCPHELDRLGALGDGGKWMCGVSRIQDKPDCVVYSFGIDSSYSFEAALLHSTRFCQVWIYDSTKGDGAKNHIPRELRHRAFFRKLALGASDKHGPGDDPKTWTLRSLMAENGAFLFFLSHPPSARENVGLEYTDSVAAVQDTRTSTSCGSTWRGGSGRRSGRSSTTSRWSAAVRRTALFKRRPRTAWNVPEREGVGVR
ncbi:methyltransferase domain-containing protein [Ganoderma leucocontextum]|nr:methyltransferase domain-containing protein [Ganoderma leucocontextum]